MVDNILDTPEKQEAAISSFRDLLGHPGWILLEQIVNANIAILTEAIINGGQSEEVMNRLRDKLQINKEIINTPRNQIKSLQTPISPVDDPDPYEKHKILDKVEEE